MNDKHYKTEIKVQSHKVTRSTALRVSPCFKKNNEIMRNYLTLYAYCTILSILWSRGRW